MSEQDESGSGRASSADEAADPAEGSPATDPASTTAPDPTTAASADNGSAPAETAAFTQRPPDRTHKRFRLRRSAPSKPRRKAPWWELPALVVLAIGIAILVKSFVIQPFYIPSDSMEKTLHGCPGCHGDRILVNKLIYDFRDPHPGDIVVFHAPPGWNDEPISKPPSNPVIRVLRGFGQLIGFVPPDGQILVKRVIAVGGQTVKGDGAGGVYISDNGPNGHYRKLVEPYVYAPPIERGDQAPFGPVTIPKGRLWVMGDHRTDSADSRFHCVPGGPEGQEGDRHCNPTSSTVPVSDVIGKAFVIAWPPSRWRTLGTPTTFDHDTSAAALSVSSAAPLGASAAVVLPVFLVRRKRRRRRR
jgi:signal peptidase I